MIFVKGIKKKHNGKLYTSITSGYKTVTYELGEEEQLNLQKNDLNGKKYIQELKMQKCCLRLFSLYTLENLVLKRNLAGIKNIAGI